MSDDPEAALPVALRAWLGRLRTVRRPPGFRFTSTNGREAFPDLTPPG